MTCLQWALNYKCYVSDGSNIRDIIQRHFYNITCCQVSVSKHVNSILKICFPVTN